MLPRRSAGVYTIITGVRSHGFRPSATPAHSSTLHALAHRRLHCFFYIFLYPKNHKDFVEAKSRKFTARLLSRNINFPSARKENFSPRSSIYVCILSLIHHYPKKTQKKQTPPPLVDQRKSARPRGPRQAERGGKTHPSIKKGLASKERHKE